MNHLTVRDLAMAGTAPSGQVLDMIRDSAKSALKFDGDYDVQIEFMSHLRKTLVGALGYRPPPEDQFEIHFLHLLALIDGQQITEDSGTRIGKAGKDWDAEIREVSVKLAGRPL